MFVSAAIETRKRDEMVKREFIVERQGRSFVLYAGLLDLAHSQGLKSIHTELAQIPSEGNRYTAIVLATVETEKGTFTGIGDASPLNVTNAMLNCTIRLAETRAKARALRDAVNVGVAAFEELGDPDEGNESSDELGEVVRMPSSVATEDRPVMNGVGFNGGVRGAPQAGPGPATIAQVRAIYSIGRDQHHLAETEIDQKSVSLYGAPPAELSRKQASDLITSLKNGPLK